nr:hypothetical protein [Pectinatus sottacetonis]
MTQLKAFLLNVAFLPSNTPALASTADPVQIDKQYVAVDAIAYKAFKNIVSEINFLVPILPGITKTPDGLACAIGDVLTSSP